MTAALLTLAQRLSPAFPVGSFAYSHGLEWAIAGGDVTDADTLLLWVEDVLAHGSGRSDAILLAHALVPGADLRMLSDVSLALAAGAERVRETLDQGRAYLAALPEDKESLALDLPYPVALGATCRDLDLAAETVVAFYLQAFAGMLVQAAVRFVPIGQTAGQRVIAALHPLMMRVAEEAITTPLEGIASGAFRSDLAAMRHETMDVRIFRT